MSRFNTPQAVLRTALVTTPRPAAALSAASPIFEIRAHDAGLVQRAGFAVLCLLVVAAYANEFAVRLFHVKAYVSTVSWFLLPVLLVLSGNLLRGLRDVIGRLWLLFLAWVLLAVPFSVWPGGSVSLLVTYVSHGWILAYYCAAFLIAVRHARRFMLFLIAADSLLLLNCFWFGQFTDGRFEIPKSMFSTNANDLALQLLIAITQFAYLLYQREVWKRVAGTAAIFVALTYLLKTGSRGAFFAVLVLAGVSVVLAQRRLRLVLIAVPLVLAAMLMVPPSIFHRLTLVNLERAGAASGVEDRSAAGSQTQRIALLRQSIEFAVAHPLFGVGPGQFAVAASADAQKQGSWSPWLGTHNSYTEIASECGIPAFLLYTSVLGITLVSNFRMLQRTRRSPELAELNALAFCLFSGALVYAICTVFFHIAYSGYLPTIAGMTIALRLSANRILWS